MFLCERLVGERLVNAHCRGGLSAAMAVAVRLAVCCRQVIGRDAFVLSLASMSDGVRELCDGCSIGCNSSCGI